MAQDTPSYERLPDHVRAFIVQRLACYESPAEVASAVEEEFGLKLTSSYVSNYNPLTKRGENLAREWVELFEKTRDEFQRGLYDVGIVWKAYRLKRLDEMERALRNGGKYLEAAQLIEQAAKEIGGAFEQRRRDGAITLDTLQKAIDELAQAVVAEVGDEAALQRIEERWGKTMRADEAPKHEFGW